MKRTQHDIRSVLICILQNRSVGFEVVIAACEAITADAQFNQWTATAAKSAHSDIDMIDLIERYGDLADECTMVWEQFRINEDAGQLLSSVQTVRMKLIELTPSNAFLESIESEWEPDTGFFWNLREGKFAKQDFDRTLMKFSAMPNASDAPIPARLVSVLWYAPLFMQWQTDRVREHSDDVLAYTVATNTLTTEVERILGVP